MKIGGTCFHYDFRKVNNEKEEVNVKKLLEKINVIEEKILLLKKKKNKIRLDKNLSNEENIHELIKNGITSRKEIRNQFKLNKIVPPGNHRLQKAINVFPKIVVSKLGRPTIVDENTRKIVYQRTIERPSEPLWKLQFYLKRYYGINISKSSLSVMRRNLGFIFKKPRNVQYLNSKHIEQRKQFVNNEIQQLKKETKRNKQLRRMRMRKLIFSDESRICIKNDSDRMMWIKRGLQNEQTFNQKKIKYTGIMVFGAIGINYKSKLVFCDKKIDSEEYIQIIKKSGVLKIVKGKQNTYSMTLRS